MKGVLESKSTLLAFDSAPAVEDVRPHAGGGVAFPQGQRTPSSEILRKSKFVEDANYHPAAPRSTFATRGRDRKSTRLNSSHVSISYAVFCLKKKKHNNTQAK